MADPASLAITIAKTSWTVGEGRYSLVIGNLSINENIRMLHGESKALSNNAEGIGKILKRPEIAQFYDAELWDDANAALDLCRAPLDELQTTLRGLKASTGAKWSLGDLKRVIQSNLKEDQIVRLRSQLHSHNNELSGIQGRITMLISSKGYLSLLQEMTQLRMDMQARKTPGIKQLASGGQSSYEPEIGLLVTSPKPLTRANISKLEDRGINSVNKPGHSSRASLPYKLRLQRQDRSCLVQIESGRVWRIPSSGSSDLNGMKVHIEQF